MPPYRWPPILPPRRTPEYRAALRQRAPFEFRHLWLARAASFDVNDFDETAPGPWEWDLKRLAVSLEVAGRENGLSTKQRGQIVRRATRSYRETIRELAGMSMLDVWYAHLDMDELLPRFRSLVDPKRTPGVWHAIAKARAHDSLQAFDKLCRAVDGEPRIVDDPPLIVAIEEFVAGVDSGALADAPALLRQVLSTHPRTKSKTFTRAISVRTSRAQSCGDRSVGTDAWIMLFLDAPMTHRYCYRSRRLRPPSWSNSPRRANSPITDNGLLSASD